MMDLVSLVKSRIHSTICSDCGVETQVPFKPTEGRPVYCRDCLPNHRKL